MSQRYFLTAESTYEDLRRYLDSALEYPNALGQSIFQPPLQVSRDSFRRVLLAVDTDLPGYATVSAAIAPLLSSEAMEELDEATYLAAVASATAGASNWNDISGKPSTFPPGVDENGVATLAREGLPIKLKFFETEWGYDAYVGIDDTAAGAGLFLASGDDDAPVKVYGNHGFAGNILCAGVKFASDNTTQTTAWTGAFSYNDLDDLPTTLSGYGITDAVSSSDSRLSDARTPTAHSHAWSDITSGVPSTFTPSAHTQAWSTITSTPTTISGYGITDGVTTSDTRLASNGNKGDITVASNGASWTINAGAVVTADLADSAVTTAKIAASAVTDAKIADVAASKLTGTLALARLPVTVEKSSAVGNSGTATTLSLSSASVQTVTLNGNCTFTMPTATAGASLTVILTQGGSNTATFTSVKWPSGAAPTITTGANKVDVLTFVSDGTNWYGVAVQNLA